ncbi:MAG: proprotein convertase P-domain-containing protein [Nannocystaceae bacterium]
MTYPSRRPLALSLGLLTASACSGDDVSVTSATSATTSESDTGTASTTATTTSSSTTASTTDAETVGTSNPTTTGPTTTSTTEPTTTGPTTTSPTTTDPTTTDVTTSSGTDTDTTTTGGVDSDLCVHLGGPAGVDALHLDFLGRVLVDPRINGYFLNASVDGAHLLQCLDEQIGEAVGCAGVTYTCQNMAAAHLGMGISSLDFGDLAEDYALALAAHQMNNPDLTDPEVTAILDVLGSMAPDIVEDPSNDLTIYQRVGRKPALLGMVGSLQVPGSFLDVVAQDVVINGFFGNTDFNRLATCFTRQLGDLDGPVIYGEEVDSPAPGVDDGVALADPCKPMDVGHEGLQNDNNELIVYEDFVALVYDLGVAMANAGFAQADVDGIIAAMLPLCVDIVDDPNQCPGNAQTILVKKTSLTLDIPDDNYDGSVGSMACVDLNVIDDGINLVDAVAEVELAIEHSRIGDLVVKVRSPSGTITTLMSRPGLAEPADDGTGCCGDSSSMKKVFPVTFRDGGLVDAEQMGIGQVVCQDDGFCDYFPNPDKGPGTNLADFHGEPSKGIWSVCVGDAGTAMAGQIGAVTLVIDKVKFPPK